MFFDRSFSKKKCQPKDLSENGNLLENMEQYEYLGIVVDSRLRFKKHIDKCVNNFNHMLYISGKIRKSLTKNCALTVYKSMSSIFRLWVYLFCIVCRKIRSALQKLQNIGLRIVVGLNNLSNVKDMAYNGPHCDEREIFTRKSTGLRSNTKHCVTEIAQIED